MMEAIAAWLVDLVHYLGYPGIFLFTFLESTFVPIPSEATMVPVGYLVQQGHMNLWIALFLSIAGTVSGSVFNYYLAVWLGRPFLRRYGKYMCFPHEKMAFIERFFKSHGQISILSGRLIPGVRHVISFPAGLAQMDLKLFSIYTGIGGGIWMATLIGVGYFIGGNKELVHHYMPYITTVVVTVVAAIVVLYIRRHRRMLRQAVRIGE